MADLLSDVREMNARVAALWWQPEDPKADYMDPRSHSRSAHLEMRALLNRVEAALAPTPDPLREAAQAVVDAFGDVEWTVFPDEKRALTALRAALAREAGR